MRRKRTMQPVKAIQQKFARRADYRGHVVGQAPESH